MFKVPPEMSFAGVVDVLVDVSVCQKNVLIEKKFIGQINFVGQNNVWVFW